MKPQIFAHFLPLCLLSTLISISLISGPASAQALEEGETYSISLVKKADSKQEIQEVNEKKVLTEKYIAKDGDYIWKVLRDKGLLEKNNLAELLAMLKKLNSSLANINLIHPGEEIVIPLLIAPMEGMPAQIKTEPPKVISPEQAKTLNAENYTIKQGDTIIRIIRRHYNIPDNVFYNEYLDLIKQLNPSIENLNHVNPGQKIKIPIYSAQSVRVAIEPDPTITTRENKEEKEKIEDLGAQLGKIITLLNEEWVTSGKHFIPIKSGGQINLSAESYPIIDLINGNKVIVDLYNDLPDRMSNLITSSWNNYKVVSLNKDDDLKMALDKILRQCAYHEIYPSGKPLVIGGDISLRVTSDWIIKKLQSQAEDDGNITILNIYNSINHRIPGSIKTFLGSLNINVIEYPERDNTETETLIEPVIMTADKGISNAVEIFLDLLGQPFSKNMEIPIFQSQNQGYNLIVKADYLFHKAGKDYIIDHTGLEAEITSLLKEHQFQVLQASSEEDLAVTVTSVLSFLDVEFDSNPHPFSVLNESEAKNIQIIIPGIAFNDKNDQPIFATQLNIPPPIAAFLAANNYKILKLQPL